MIHSPRCSTERPRRTAHILITVVMPQKRNVNQSVTRHHSVVSCEQNMEI